MPRNSIILKMVPLGVFQPGGRTIEELDYLLHRHPVLVLFIGDPIENRLLVVVIHFFGLLAVEILRPLLDLASLDLAKGAPAASGNWPAWRGPDAGAS